MIAQQNTQQIAIIGLGSMAGAILTGIISGSSPAATKIRATVKSQASAAAYPTNPQLELRALEADSAANNWAVSGSGIVLLAVKPWAICETLAAVKDDLAPGALVISVAAGVPLAVLRNALGARDDVQLVRAMPNTPALIGKGVTGLAAENAASPDMTEPKDTVLEKAKQLFLTVGEVVVVPESQIDALSTVSGSGPAYLFWFVEQLTAAAQRLGFDPHTAKQLAENTVTGAAALLEQGEKTAAEQRAAVTSPGGTTEQAIAAFNSAQPAAIFDSALNAALVKAQEIAANAGNS